ncbi:hypothetical protein MMC34_005925 [Xylographa carneopallida]|nr:hypothetical protein [Xylographa carneopallida]
MHFLSLLSLASLLLLTVASNTPSGHSSKRRDARLLAIPRVHESREIVLSAYSSHQKRLAYASIDNLLLRRAALALARPRRVNVETQSQEQKNKEALNRANSQQQKDKDSSENTINDAHKKATTAVDSANAGEKWGDDQIKQAQEYMKTHPNDRKTHNKLQSALKDKIVADKNGEWKKNYAAYSEQQTDMKALGDFKQKSTDDQTAEFNKNGDAKSAEQKAAEKAKAGFMKFLQVFGEIMSVLTMAFPGGGEVLAVGIKLGETAAKVGEDIAKIAKLGLKAEKFGDKVRDVLNMKPGTQQIAGVSGKAMADLQSKLLNELVGLAVKNTDATAKKVKDTKLATPKQNLPTCKGPRIQGCNPPKRSAAAKQQIRKAPTTSETDTLKLKKSWEIALAPAKALPMNAIMMYMSGNSLQIFSIMMVFMLFKNPLQALLQTNQAFTRYETDGTRGKLWMVKGVYVLMNLVALALGVWKVNGMGLLPTTRSDWLAWETARVPLEQTIFAFK